MKLIKALMLSLMEALWIQHVSAQPANASLNIQAQNGGVVAVGNTMDRLIAVTNTGPNSIQAFRVRATVSVPTALATILATAQQSALPTGWTVSANGGGAIHVRNGTDLIPMAAQRQRIVRIQAIAIGGPST